MKRSQSRSVSGRSGVVRKGSGRRSLAELLDARLLFSGKVFVTTIGDINGNGVRDTGEEPLGGVTVYVDLNHNGTLDATDHSGVTNTDGELTLTSVPAGSQVLRQIPPAGWAPSPSSSLAMNVTVLNNDTIEPYFYNTPTSGGTVDGTVWNDTNGDGSLTASDELLSGWTVFIDANNNGALDSSEPSAISDANGYYTITDIPLGSYVIREILQAGWEPTLGYDTKNGVSVSPGSTSTIDFGNFSLNAGSISGAVWNDVNTDGVRGASEPGLDSWTVFIDSNANGVLDLGERSTLSDASGNYSLAAVPAGTYRLAEIVQSGWTASNPSGGATSVTVLSQSGTTANFGNFTPTPGTINGSVWSDLNADGSRGTEPGLNGWTVFIDANGNGSFDGGELSGITTPTGDYTIAGLPAGSWQVREIVQPGWSATAPGTASQLVNVGNGATVGGVNFGNYQRSDGGIGGVAFADLNHNGVRDAGEGGLSGITVYLDVNDNAQLDPGEVSTVTSADLFYTPATNESGSYTFSRLPAGYYRVRQILPAPLSGTLPVERAKAVTLATGELQSNVNFADRYRANEIHGLQYQDTNGNHVRDAGEPGIAGVVVYVDLNRNNALDKNEPRTTTAADGTYSFSTGIAPGAYVLRELLPSGYKQVSPATVGGILWPTGVSNPASGNVTPGSITTSLAQGQTHNENVSITLPGTGGITNKVDVFLLFDDTGSFTSNSPIVRAAFPQIISSLQASMPGVDLAFGVGRFEEYANFAAEYSTGRPFILNQPMIAASDVGQAAMMTAVQSALDRTTPGYGGDQPETDIEALFQTVTGRGFDGNNNGTTSDSGAAGPVSTQLTPGNSGDVPAFASFTVDAAGNVLPASGNIGGAGFRPGALPVILLATDTGFAFQPRGETSVTGVGGLTLPVSALTQTSRPTTPFNNGAGIQETITALNALGALVIGLGTNAAATVDPRQGLEAIAKLTGAVNQSAATIANGTTDPIAPGDPFYFQIATGFGASVASGVVSAISNAVINSAVNISLHSTDPRVQITSNPGVVNNVGAGETASFSVTFTGDGRPHRFDLQFVRQGTDVVLGSIPVVIGTPISGDCYEFEDLEDGDISVDTDFGDHFDLSAPINASPSFSKGADVSVLNNVGATSITGWATGLNAGSSAESNQLLTFLVSTDRPELFTVQPIIDEDGTLSFTPADGAVGNAVVSVQIHDSGLTLNGGIDTSTVQTFLLSLGTSTPLAVIPNFVYQAAQTLQISFSQDVQSTLALGDLQLLNRDTSAPVTLTSFVYNPAAKIATVGFESGVLASGNYRLTIATGAIANLASPVTYDFKFQIADATGDGTADFNDFLVLQNNFGKALHDYASGDFNYDGVIDFNDFLILQNNFGQSVPVLPVAKAPSKSSAIKVTSKVVQTPIATRQTVQSAPVRQRSRLR